MKYIPLSVHHSWISFRGTERGRSFLFPKRRQVALGTLFMAIQYQTFLIFSQLYRTEMSKTRTTPWHDLKQVATMDRNFSCPAVSQIHNLTYLSCSWIILYPKSMVVTARSAIIQLWTYRQKMEVLPTQLSPTRIILYLGPSKTVFTAAIQQKQQRHQLLLYIRNFITYQDKS